jgi:hypothetical protein
MIHLLSLLLIMIGLLLMAAAIWQVTHGAPTRDFRWHLVIKKMDDAGNMERRINGRLR